MRTFFEFPPDKARRLARSAAARLRALRAGPEDGFLLVEVMVSAMLVALIVTATFNGLDVATRISSDQRHRDEAAILAAQSQEQLRTEPASALDTLETSPHKYTAKVNGTTYTVTQEAKAVSAAGNTTGCSVTETSAQTANILVTSKVSWPQQAKAGRPEVKQSSLITPPVGSAIEVDVLNGEGGGVQGVTAKAEFIPNEAGTYNTVEGTTDAAGCVILTGIQATSAKVYIAEKPGFVTPSGALKVEPKTLTIAPNITTHYAVKYAEAGRIQVQYTYEGATTWGGKEVKNDTFIAFNSETGVAPEYESGSTAFEYDKTKTEEPYRALTGAYSNSAYTAAGAKYSVGRLFPFKAGWSAWAGDCPASRVTGFETNAIVVQSGKTTTVKVPLSYTKLSVYTGSSAKEALELDKEAIKEAGKNLVKITDTTCSGAEEGLNEYSPSYVHEQKEVLTEGRLENPFQPFGSFSICVYEPKQKKSYTTTYTNSTVAGSTPTIYLKQKTAEEKASEIAASKSQEEKFAKEKSEYESAKKTRETEESEAKTEETEIENALKGPETKAYWEKLKAEGKITPAQLTTKEKTKATLEKEEKEGKITKATRETAEKTTETKAYWERQKNKGEITSAQLTEKEKTKATLESEKSTIASEKATRKTAEEAATTAKTKRESEEATFKTNKKLREERETAEAANKVTVEAKTC